MRHLASIFPSRTSNPQLRHPSALALPLIAVVALIGATSACDAGGTPAATAAEPSSAAVIAELLPGQVRIGDGSSDFVHVAPVGPEGAEIVLDSPARVAFAAGAHSKVGAPVGGIAREVHVRPGEVVSAGQLLVVLESPEAATARAEHRSARATLRAMEAELERQRRLRRDGITPERSVAEAELAQLAAEAEFTRTREVVRNLGNGDGTRVDVRSPIDGTVLSVDVSVGSFVESSGDAMVEVGDISTVEIVADVYESDLRWVRAGSVAEVVLPWRAEPLQATVRSIGASLASDLRRAPVFLDLDDATAAAAAELRPGVRLRARLRAPVDGGVMVPATAVLIRGGQHTMVYVEVEPNLFAARPVTVGRALNGDVHVVDGLASGERVAVRGALLLDSQADQLL